MKSYANQTRITPESWWASLAGALYFLLAGIGLMQGEIPLAWDVPAGLRTFDWLFFFGLLLPAIGLAAGWVLGFPRWSYPYTGGLLVYSLYLMNVSTPLLNRQGTPEQSWGWRAWIPFLLACATGFLLSLLPERSAAQSKGDSPRPERSTAQSEITPPRPERSAAQSKGASPHFLFLSNLRADPSLATYLMFGWMPLLLFISFDEMDRLFTLVFLLVFTVLMVAIALLYQRLRKPQSRTRALAGGVIACILLIEIGTIAYWLPLNGVNVPLSLLWGVVILAIMLYPYLFVRRAAPVPRAEEA